MIYKITIVGVPTVINRGGRLIIISADNMAALVSDITDTSELNILEEYNDNLLSSLLEDPVWKQPCTNC